MEIVALTLGSMRWVRQSRQLAKEKESERMQIVFFCRRCVFPAGLPWHFISAAEFLPESIINTQPNT